MEYSPHNVEWNLDKVIRFWNFFSQIPNYTYFAEQVGQELIDLVAKKIPLQGRILDYGCGNGYLMRYLIDRRVANIYGCDYPDNSVNQVNKMFQVEQNFGGCKLMTKLPVDFPNDMFDSLFFLETYEHLLNEDFLPTLTELRRLVKVGGYVIITTPNEERLVDSQMLCPDCGAHFHKIQHIRSTSRATITIEMERLGFSTVWCGVYNLRGTDPNPLINLAGKFYRATLGSKSPKKNLIYIGQK